MTGSQDGLDGLQTPCLLLDEGKLSANLAGMRAQVERHGVTFRPHLKTAKSIDVARMAMTGPDGPATVSTLKEAEYFAERGVRDLTYAVGIAPTSSTASARSAAAGARTSRWFSIRWRRPRPSRDGAGPPGTGCPSSSRSIPMATAPA